MRFPFAAVVYACVAVTVGANSAHAVDATVLTIDDDSGNGFVADYSQGIHIEASLSSSAAPVSCRHVEFSVATAAAPDDACAFENVITDATGTATARLTLVNGRYENCSFP